MLLQNTFLLSEAPANKQLLSASPRGRRRYCRPTVVSSKERHRDAEHCNKYDRWFQVNNLRKCYKLDVSCQKQKNMRMINTHDTLHSIAFLKAYALDSDSAIRPLEQGGILKQLR